MDVGLSPKGDAFAKAKAVPKAGYRQRQRERGSTQPTDLYIIKSSFLSS
jgi:hypothetical protein